ncbi:low affinity immunoglobulin epsilon Fc receptor-like, partial [Crassostrea virginica]
LPCLVRNANSSSNERIPIIVILCPFLAGCETGWVEFKGHCYHKGHSNLTWSEAKMECRKLCSYLVEIESKEEADWISKTFLEKDIFAVCKFIYGLRFLNISENCGSNIFNCAAWTGLNDLDIEGRYIWDHSNASLTLTNWHPKEPSLSKPEQALNRDCIDILRGGGLNDRTCTHLNWVICEKQF